jgi:hypothetical protein
MLLYNIYNYLNVIKCYLILNNILVCKKMLFNIIYV